MPFQGEHRKILVPKGGRKSEEKEQQQNTYLPTPSDKLLDLLFIKRTVKEERKLDHLSGSGLSKEKKKVYPKERRSYK